MYTLSDFTAFFKLPTYIILGLTLAVGGVFTLNELGTIHLDRFSPLAREGVMICLLLLGGLSIGSIGNIFWEIVVGPVLAARGRREARLEKSRDEKETESKALVALQHLAPMEWGYLAHCVLGNEQSFAINQYTPSVQILIQKGLVGQGPGANQLSSFIIKDFAWIYLKENKDSFLNTDDSIEEGQRIVAMGRVEELTRPRGPKPRSRTGY